MHSHPDVSEFVAYLGWNVGYLFVFFAILYMRREGTKRFFHPLMLLPVLISIPRPVLYIKYGGVANNLWEVGITTAAAVLCMQDIVYSVKNKDKLKKFPRFSVILMLYIISNYGMWTASCFSRKSELLNPYLYFSVFGSLMKIFLVFGAGKFYESGMLKKEQKSASVLRLQVLLQATVSMVIIGICVLGFFTAYVIKNFLSSDNSIFHNESQLVIYLFVISLILILMILSFFEEEYSGENLAEVYDKALPDNIINVKNGRITTSINDKECTLFISPILGQWYSVIVVDNAKLFEDTYTSRRSYRDIMPQEKVPEEIKNGSGTQFDPPFAKIMIKPIEADTEYSMREKTKSKE